ncbi:MAG: hypothetical protein ACFBSD_08165 [Paracoccaceae bacterium]
MTKFLSTALGAVILAGVSGPKADAAPVPLTFANPQQTATGTSDPLDSDVIEELVVTFTGVATDQGRTVDARITATVKDDTDFASQGGTGVSGDPGFIANYNSDAGEPNGDLGFLFFGNGIDPTEDGITLLFEFFDGTGIASGTFTNPLSIPQIEFAVYDVDGDTSPQTEFSACASRTG